MTPTRIVLVAGLLVGAAGIAQLWNAGVDFPMLPPPGIVILTLGALIVALVRRRWTLGLGAALAAFVIVGFLVSPTGIDNFTGEHGADIAIGQRVQVAGVVTALIAGLVELRRTRSRSGCRRGPRAAR